jgi:hypothetical protein
MTKEEVIRAAHDLGMHDDGVFHVECPECVETSVSGYLAECSEILRGMGKDETVVRDFCTYFRSYPEVAYTLHEEPVYEIAMYFGINKLGDEMEADPDFQAIEHVAAPIRRRRCDEAMAERARRESRDTK